MPGVLNAPVSTGLFPISLSRQFILSHDAQGIANEYSDGTLHRSPLVNSARRTWKLAKRLAPAAMGTLRAHWQANRGAVFGFFDPYETIPPFTANPIGTAGFYLVRYASDWAETIGMARSDAEVELIEVAASTDILPPPPPPPATGTTIVSLSVSVMTSFSAPGGIAFGFATAAWSASPAGISSGNIEASRNIVRDSTFFAPRTDTASILISGPISTSLLPGSTVAFSIDGTLTNTGENDFTIYETSMIVRLSDGTSALMRPGSSSFSAGSSPGTTGLLTGNPANAYDGDPTSWVLFSRSLFNGFATGGVLTLTF